MLRRFFALLMVLALSACGVSSASELPSEKGDGPDPEGVDVSVFRDALANGRFAEFDNFQPERALLAAGQARILLLGTVRGFRLTPRTGSVVMSVRVEETLKGAGFTPITGCAPRYFATLAISPSCPTATTTSSGPNRKRSRSARRTRAWRHSPGTAARACASTAWNRSWRASTAASPWPRLSRKKRACPRVACRAIRSS